jgi:hypothetical protein
MQNPERWTFLSKLKLLIVSLSMQINPIMHSQFAKIALVLALMAFISTAYAAKSSKELIGDLQTALKEEAAASQPKKVESEGKAENENESKNENKGKAEKERQYRMSLLSQLAAQLEGGISQGSYETPRILAQISAASPSEKVQQICKELSQQLRTEREQRETEFLSQADAAIKSAGAAAVKAKSEKDLDAVLQELGHLRENRNEQMSELLRRASAKVEATVQFITRWQDHLAQANADNLKAAREILRNLAESSSYPIVPRSEILSRMQAISEAETKAKALPGSLIPAKVEAICSALKNPAEISLTLEQLTALRQQFPSEVDSTIVSELDGLNTLYKQIQASLTIPVNMLDNAHHFIDLRLQLILLALPRYLGLADDYRPQSNESVGQFLDRIIADAKRTENWPLMLKTMETSRMISRGSMGGYSTGSFSFNPLRSFVTGRNQEQAGQYASAVVSYQEALKDTENVVPLNVVRDRLATIKKEHSNNSRKECSGCSIRRSLTIGPVICRIIRLEANPLLPIRLRLSHHPLVDLRYFPLGFTCSDFIFFSSCSLGMW